MGLESASYVNSLVTTNPIAGDKRERGDDHLRLIKTAVKGSLPADLRNVSSPAVGDVLQYTSANGGGFANLPIAQVLANAVGRVIVTGLAVEGDSVFSGYDIIYDTTGTASVTTNTIDLPWTVAAADDAAFIQLDISIFCDRAVGSSDSSKLQLSLRVAGANEQSFTLGHNTSAMTIRYYLRTYTAAQNLDITISDGDLSYDNAIITIDATLIPAVV